MTNAKDITRAMEYSHSVSPETLTLGAYSVDVWQDSDSDCPYDNCDGMSPALWLSLRSGLTEYGRHSLERFFDNVTPAWVSRNWRAICSAMDIDPSSHEEEAREWGTGHLGYVRKECFAESLCKMRSDSWGDAIDYLETLRALYQLAGVPAETFQRNGYCQGDSVYGLVVMTPAWAQTVGARHAMGRKYDKAACDKDMAAQADEYGAWVWGDVYGFTVSGPGADDDSCGGFYGSNPMESGIAEAIAESINGAKRAARRAHMAQVKTWIRNRVPLSIRSACPIN